jgi:predicted ArsR family transcriptional regulator
MLVRLAAQAGIGGDEAADIGRDQGRIDGQNLRQSTDSCLRALNDRLTSLGFDPAIVEGDAGPTVAFTHCPFAELAEAYPEVVCHLHRGLVEGIASAFSDCEIGEFRTCIHRTPCQVDLVVEPVG